MPSEQQELELRVTLDDQASAQLQHIREALSGLGATSGGVSHASGHIGDFEQAIGRLGRAALGFGRASVEVAKVIGPMPVAMGALAYQTYRVHEAMKEWAVGLQTAGNAARMAGIGIGEFQNIVSQLRQAGVSAGDATSLITNFTKAYGELMTAGSARRGQLIQLAGPEFAGHMIQGIQLIGQLSTDTQKLNAIRQMGENVYQNKLAETHDAMRAAAARDDFFAALNVQQLANLRGDMKEQDARTAANMKAELEKADKLAKANSEEEQTRGRIGQIIKSSFADQDKWITEQITFIEKWLLKHAEEQEKFKRDNENKPGWYTRGAALWDMPKDAWNQPWNTQNLISNPFTRQRLGMADGGIVSKPTVRMLGEAGPEAVIPLGQMGGLGGAVARENTEQNTDELTRLTGNVSKLLRNPSALAKMLALRPFARGGTATATSDIPTAAIIAEAGEPETVVGSSGVRRYDRPTVGTLQPGESVIPTYEEEYTKALIGAGAGPTDVKQWLNKRGIQMNEADCAKYMTTLVSTRGGAMPPEASRYAASSWNKNPNFPQAQEGYSNDPYAINWAVWQKPGVKIGAGGQHVTEPIPQTDALGNFTGSFLNRGVNQEMPDLARQQLTEKDPKNVPYKQYHEYPQGMQSLVATPEMLSGSGYKNPMFESPDMGDQSSRMAAVTQTQPTAPAQPTAAAAPPAAAQRSPPVTRGNIKIPHSQGEIASWQQYYTNPLADIEDELSAQRSKAREAIAGVGKQGSFGANALQVGKAAWESYKYGSPTGTGFDAVLHTTLGRIAGGAVGGREQGNVLADVASPFIPRAPSAPAYSAAESALDFAKEHNVLKMSEVAFNRAKLGLKLAESAQQAIKGEGLDKSLAESFGLGRKNDIKIVQENAPPGTTVEAEGPGFKDVEHESTRETSQPLFDPSQKAKWRHPDASERARQHSAAQSHDHDAQDSLGIRG